MLVAAGRFSVVDVNVRCGYHGYMTKHIGARELKNRLGTYLRQVRSGVTIVVTDRGTPVAELRAVAPAAGDEEARLRDLAAMGLLTRPSDSRPSAPPIRLDGPPLADAIVDEREDRL